MKESSLKRFLTFHFLTKFVLITWFVVANSLHMSTGLADNGDFSRSMQIFSAGPVGTPAGTPPVNSPDSYRRYFQYWLPRWTVNFQPFSPKTSAIVIWAPGIALNLIFYSSDVLSIPLVSLFPRFVLLAALLLLFGWIEGRLPQATVALIAIGLPVTLMLTTSDTLAFLNSFYQETAALIYLFLTFASLIALRIRPSRRYLVCILASIFLLSISKSACSYWFLFLIPFVYLIWRHKDRFQARAIFVIAVPASLLFIISGTGVKNQNSYHSLFYGALPFSTNPATHLRRLGLEELAVRVDDRAYASIGSIPFSNTVNVVVHEPAILGRMLMHTADQMQDQSLDYLGKYTSDDSRSAMSPIVSLGLEDRYWGASSFDPLNAWSTLKYAVFPTGAGLLVFLACCIVWFLHCSRFLPSCPEIPLAGVVATLGSVAEMLVAMLGDGKYELIKHLFLANVLFDIAAIVFVSSAILSFLQYRQRI